MTDNTQTSTNNDTQVEENKLGDFLQEIQKFRSWFSWVNFLILCFLSGLSSFIYTIIFLDVKMGKALVKASMANEHVSNLTNLYDFFLPPIASMAYTICFAYAGIVMALHYTYAFFNKDYAKAEPLMKIVGEAGGLITAAAITPAAIKSSWGMGIVVGLWISIPNLGLMEIGQELLTTYTVILLAIALGFLVGTIALKKNHKFSITELSIDTNMLTQIISCPKKSKNLAIAALVCGGLIFIAIQIIQVKSGAESWSSLAKLVEDYCIGENVCGTCPAKD
jgi:hypothetical protein